MRKQFFRIRPGMAALAGGLALAVTAGLLSPVEAAPPDFDGPKAQATTKVPVAKVTSKAKPAEARSIPPKLPAVRWPASAAAEVALPAAAAPPRSGGPAAAASWVPVAGLPVRVQPGPDAAVRSLRVRVHERDAAAKIGLNGVVLQLTRTDAANAGRVGVAVDSREFAGAFGGGWADRLRLVTVPECALTTPQLAQCRRATPVAGSQVDSKGVAAGTVAASSLVVLAAAVSGSSGDYSASGLAQSATWSAGTQSGSFTWSYPLRVPPAVGGPSPQLGISYDSGSVDGKSAATNNQPGWLGEGFELGAGFIERRYVSCQEDMTGGNNTTKTGDLCWKTDNATLSMAGMGSELLLVKGTTNTWKLKNENGARIERLFDAIGSPDNDGEYWKLTTADGTQYFFGRTKRYAADPLTSNATLTAPVAGNHSGEECHAGTFTASFCPQAWRWNLDHVVDVHGNSMSYFWQKEVNRYGKEAATKVADYDRGAYLKEIHYGQRAGSEGSMPPAKVDFDVAERCIPSGAITCAEAQLTSANAAHWPDVPFDQLCSTSATSCPDRGSPSFFTRKRLTKVTTSVLTAGNTHTPVDSWSFAQGFPATPDSSPKGLSLNGITHTGHVGTAVTMPPVTFGYEMLRNRVEGFIDGPVMWKPRLNLVRNETGGQTSVVYENTGLCHATSDPPGAPATNTKRCFPSYWTPEGAFEPTLTWFHKYVVSQVGEKDLVGDAVDTVTNYTYSGGAAWKYDTNELTRAKYRTWSDWRGFETVETARGSDAGSTIIERRKYLRGMHGNRKSDGSSDSVSVSDSKGGSTVDHDRTNGTVLEQTSYNGGTVLATTINKPWISAPTGTAANGETSTFTGPGVATTYTRLTDTTEQVTRVTVTNDSTFGVTTQVDDEGDLSTTADDRCTRTGYVRNTTAWLTGTVNSQQTAAVKCSATPSAAQILSETRTLYDGGAYGAAPGRGMITETQARSDQAGTFVTRAKATYDARGRVETSTDALGKTTRTAYTQRAVTGQTYTGGLVSVSTTDPAGFKATTGVNPAWGVPETETDINNKVTSLAHDGLGRLAAVWLPTQPKASNADAPSMRFSYTLSNTAPAVVKSEELRSTVTGTPSYITSYEIFDGLLRPKQTQAPEAGPDGGRVVSDVEYDSRGLAIRRNGPYYAGGAPSGSLVRITDVQKQVSNELTYDRAGRVTRERFISAGVERYVTSTTYGGDFVTVDPPDGQAPTTAWSDARGNTTKIWKYNGNSPSGAYEETTYSYYPSDAIKQIRSPGGAKWDYEYDFRGRLTKTDDPDKGVVTTTYDANDRVVTARDARGQTIWTGYDDLGRVTETRKDNAAGAQLTKHVYDTLAKGKPTSSTRYAGANQYVSEITGYDDAYRPTGTKTTIPAAEGALAGTYESTLTYNEAGNVTQMKLPAVPGMPAETLETVYDGRLALPANLSSNNAGVGSVVNGVIRSPFGESLIVGLGIPDKAVWFGYAYEEGTRRLVGSTVQRETQGGPTDVSLRFDYDKGGNVKSIIDSPTASGSATETQCFRHDGQARLLDAWTPTNGCAASPAIGNVGGPAGYWHSYSYDAFGNRKTETQHTIYGDIQRAYTTPALTSAGKGRPHSLAQVVTTPLAGAATTVAYNYDAAGNLTSRNTSGATTSSEAFNFNAEGSLESTTKDSAQNSSYVYDADGARLIKKENGKATLYLDGTEVELTTATGALVSTRYYQFDGRTVATRQSSGGGVRLQFGDHQGTPIWSVDRDTTNGVQRRRFTPFGADRQGFTPSPFTSTKGFVNGDRDTATGLTHLGAREYDPAIGRFISVDPVMNAAEPQTLNGYAYARNNPSTLSDASGLYAVWDPVSGGYTCYGPCGSPAPWEDSYSPKQDHKVRDGGSAYSKKNAGRDVRGDAKEHQARRQVQVAEQKQAEYKRRLVQAAKQIGKILMDELGITAALDCFTKADLGGCAETAINVLLSVVAGAAAKLIAKYGLRWKAGARLVGTLKRLGGEVWKGLGGFIEWSGKAKKARQELSEVAGSCMKKSSFVPATRVRLADGTSKPIKQVKVGDRVLATDPVTGKTTGKTVLALRKSSGKKPLAAVTVATATGARSVIATADHPFWQENARRWTDAEDLRRGDTVLLAGGSTAEVTGIRTFTRQQTVNNLTVADLHTYYVLAGNTPVLVHNTGLACDIGPDGWPVPTMDNCKACATEIQKIVGGDIVHIKDAHGAPALGPSKRDPGGSWTEHYAVIKEGTVFDGFTGRKGLPLNEYRAQWEYGDYLSFTPVG